MKKTVFNVMFISVLAKLLGFARELVLVYCVGANGISDAYLISLTIPGTIFQFVGTGLMTCYIPVFLRTVDGEGKGAGNTYTNSILSVVLLFSTVVIAVVWLFGGPIVKVFASGFEGETFAYAVTFTKINILSLYVSSFIYVFNSLLQVHDRFEIIAAAAIPNSTIILISIVLGTKYSVWLLPIGSILAAIGQLCFIVPSVRRCDFQLRLNIKYRSSSMLAMYQLLMPVIVGVSVSEINVLVDKTIASRVSEGGISTLTYAYSLIMFVQGIFGQTIATVYYPSITKSAEQDSNKDLKEVVDEAVKGMLFFLIPITAGSVVLSGRIVSLLYGRGAFSDQSVLQTSQAFTGYAVGMIGCGVREIFSRIFYSVNNTKIPTANAIIGMLVNIVLNLLLSRSLGIRGLALATSTSSVISAFLLLRDARKLNLYHVDKKMITLITKMVCASIVMGVIIFMVSSELLVQRDFWCVLVLIVMGACVYIGLMAISFGRKMLDGVR